MNKVLTIKRVALLLASVAVLAITIGDLDEAAAQAVKKSRSGICHCPGGQSYDRTSNFTAFEAIDTCLASGGREPKRGQGDCSTASSSGPGHTNVGTTDKAAAEVVKKSGTGICHCPGGQFYDRTSNFAAFDTLEACIASGGREPRQGQGNCSIASSEHSAETSKETINSPNTGAVKKSGSGICHCPGGQFYERTSNFTAFDTLEACIASGGREPQRGQGVCPSAPRGEPRTMHLPKPGKYDRSAFGGWGDDDGDCQNTRHERLISRSIEPVELSEDGCLVISGYWKDPYTGNIYTAASEMEIDHVVPLFYAWGRGAHLWEPAKQRRFANDSANLLPVGGSANRSKGAAGPLEWLPPSDDFACEYLLRFSRITGGYSLALLPDESADLERLTSEKCD